MTIFVRTISQLILLLTVWAFCAATNAQSASSTLNSETISPQKTAAGQDEQQRQLTLESVARIDDHPLYVMKYYGGYSTEVENATSFVQPSNRPWACSLFAALGDKERPLYGRNFDWQENPALVLFTDSPDGYASVSMVDVSYLGYEQKDEKFDSLKGREQLLEAPLIPFDGMNEHGLVVGMAAVDGAEVPQDPDRPTVGSLRIIRLVLDQCRTVSEGIALFEKYNLDFHGGPQIHYLLADAQGNSALIEFSDRKMHVIQPDLNWQAATNFYMRGNQNRASKLCGRYSQISKKLADRKGTLTLEQAFELLNNVSQANTRWTVVYDMKNSAANIVMSRKFDRPIRLVLTDERPTRAP